MPRDLLRELIVPSDSRIVLFVIDGLGGMPRPETGLTELETAHTPDLDQLAARSICGLSEPVGAGIAPGSGPGHLALFGYDPIADLVGRGILSALGVDFPLAPTDVAARINFATIDASGNVVDRRAGRIGTDVNRRLVAKLRGIRVPGLEVFLETESEHRAVAIFRAGDLSDALDDTDPQRTGVPAPSIVARDLGAEPTAALLNRWIVEARATLADEHPANMVLLRGFAQRPDLGTFETRYGLNAASIAVYPMYRGLARLVGMDVLDTGKTLDELIDTLETNWTRHTFFYVHLKAADAAGEDGDFDRRVRIFEEVDSRIERFLALKPDCLVITGDHSTPALLKQHSWHPVPFLLYSPNEIPDRCAAFGERACAAGSLGVFPAQAAMQLMLAASLKLTKYGA
ncbi:MAG: 2,3-bisphosphoglycerate-independent phosphoglycerate mutase [Chloroflexota bacterium]|nr:MAG: 2,3-bisphosphoglycerate-independent phosphoglycerate mutase [Chloroflexota bacterium]